jgi:3-dehydroquinate dehydratase-2
MRFFVLNGPNLNLLGEREPAVYGTATLADIEKAVRLRADELGVDIEFRQTNDEGELIGWVHEARNDAQGVIVNPAAFTHYSLALREALSAIDVPVIEVHISNIYAREEWRAKSVVSGVVTGVVTGLGPQGYVRALDALFEILGI